LAKAFLTNTIALVIDGLFAKRYQFTIGSKLQSAIVPVSVFGATGDQMYQAKFLLMPFPMHW
jgi:hypothetical protein